MIKRQFGGLREARIKLFHRWRGNVYFDGMAIEKVDEAMGKGAALHGPFFSVQGHTMVQIRVNSILSWTGIGCRMKDDGYKFLGPALPAIEKVKRK